MSAITPRPAAPFVRGTRRAWGRAHLVVQALVLAAGYFAFLTLVFLDEPRPGPDGIVFRIVISVGMGVAVVASRWLRARRCRGSPDGIQVSEAMEDGELPVGADPVAWRGALERRRTEVAQEPRVIVIGLVVLAVILTGLALTSDASAFQYGFVAFLVVWAAWLVTTRGRRLAQVDALLLPLEQMAAEDDARRAAWAPPAPADRVPPAAG